MAVPGGTTSQARPRPRWLVIVGVAMLVLTLLVTVGVAVVYPRVGASMVREQVRAKIRQKLGREATFASVEVRLGHATIRGMEIRGPLDSELPLVLIDRIDIDFDALPSLVGTVRLGAARVDGVTVSVRRTTDGRDNLSDLIERLRRDEGDAGSGAGAGAGLRPTSVTVTRGKVLADDAVTGTTALVADGGATWKPGELIAQARGVSATTVAAPAASATALTVTKRTGQPPLVAIEGGELAVLPGLSLTGIEGTVAADAATPGKYQLNVAGGYGGVPGNLWTARGGIDPRALTAAIDLEAAKFQLDRLAPILERTPVVDYQSTSVDTKVRLELARDGATFSGEVHLHGLNVGHPKIAAQEVRDLDLSATVAGRFDRTTRSLVLTRGDFVARGVPFSLTGEIAKPRSAGPPTPAVLAAPLDLDEPDAPLTVATAGPLGIQQLKVRFVIPPVGCQQFLAAIPVEMVPYMTGYRMKGTFDTDLSLEVDWRDLDATKLGGSVGIKNCRVIGEPATSPRRLNAEFEHFVEVEQDKFVSFVVGPSNPDFVPFAEISPHLVNSIMSTEDSAFMRHRGFIVSEFRSALVKDLKAGRFKYGASSITMQMVKNVLLYRDKTLTRKLQELFLTWHVENTLEKERILEIYFNVIEYGPGLYGIGPAAQHYFGKPAKELLPREAAFFSSILPSPKERYKQYCANELTKWSAAKIDRILGIMRKRDRLTQEEYDLAAATPLVFVKSEDAESEDDCMRRTKRAIKHARSTNPVPPAAPGPAVPPQGPATGSPRGATRRAPTVRPPSSGVTPSPP